MTTERLTVSSWPFSTLLFIAWNTAACDQREELMYFCNISHVDPNRDLQYAYIRVVEFFFFFYRRSHYEWRQTPLPPIRIFFVWRRCANF